MTVRTMHIEISTDNKTEGDEKLAAHVKGEVESALDRIQ